MTRSRSVSHLLLVLLTILGLFGRVSAHELGSSAQIPVEQEANWADNLAAATSETSTGEEDIEVADNNQDILFPRRQTFSGIATYAHLPLEACLQYVRLGVSVFEFH
jgi:hypothetical protein